MFTIEILTNADKIVRWEVEPNAAFASYATVKGHLSLKASHLLDEDGDELDAEGEFPPRQARSTRTKQA